jgi:hypothetical protein
MDIFTTQLTRVVPVQIKTESLKVKALLKDAAIKKFKGDTDEVEEHDYYLNLSQDEKEEHPSGEDDNAPAKRVTSSEVVNKPDHGQKTSSTKEKKDSDDKDIPHFDIYI